MSSVEGNSKKKVTVKERLEKEGLPTLPIILFGTLLPAAILFGWLGFLYIILSYGDFLSMGGYMALYFFPPAGKESVIPLAVLDGLDWRLVAVSIANIDLVLALFMVWNFDLAKKLPLLGKWIKRFEESGGNLLDRRPWMRDLAFVGIVLFVVVPFEGSGGLAASIVGRIIGMNRYKVLAAVIIGAYGGCFLVATFANEIASFFTLQVTNMITIIAAVILVYVLIRIWKHTKNRKAQGSV